jgi:hypothetical protein
MVWYETYQWVMRKEGRGDFGGNRWKSMTFLPAPRSVYVKQRSFNIPNDVHLHPRAVYQPE